MTALARAYVKADDGTGEPKHVDATIRKIQASLGRKASAEVARFVDEDFAFGAEEPDSSREWVKPLWSFGFTGDEAVLVQLPGVNEENLGQAIRRHLPRDRWASVRTRLRRGDGTEVGMMLLRRYEPPAHPSDWILRSLRVHAIRSIWLDLAQTPGDLAALQKAGLTRAGAASGPKNSEARK